MPMMGIKLIKEFEGCHLKAYPDPLTGGLPFIYAINDARPYIRQTAPFRKDQFDNGTEPGEQSLTGWWIRSQMSFHSGSGINFYDPATTDENGHYRWRKLG